MSDAVEWIADHVLMPIMLVLALLLTVLAITLVVAFFMESTAETIPLRKDQWTCTASHVESGLVPAGKVMVTSREIVCDRWERRQGGAS